jgi:hypothetical protein
MCYKDGENANMCMCGPSRLNGRPLFQRQGHYCRVETPAGTGVDSGSVLSYGAHQLFYRE